LFEEEIHQLSEVENRALSTNAGEYRAVGVKGYG